MEPVDLVPSGYRFLPTADELVVDYLANWVAGKPLPGRAVAFADVYGTEPWNLLGSDRKEGYFFAERQPKASGGSRVDRTAGTGSWLLNRRQEPVKSIVDGREIVVGRRSYLSFKDGRRKNSGWVMYEYQMCSSTFETRVLCHVKKSSYQPVSGGKFMKSVESTFTEATTETLTGASSFVGQKRNREESSTLSSAAPKKPCRGLVAHSNGAFQSDLSPPPTAVVQQLLLAPVVTIPESRLSSIDSVAPNEAGVPAASPSSTDVGGGDVGITAEELEAFDLGMTAEELEAFLASPSSSVDLGGDQHCTDDAFFTREVDALLMSDATDTVSTTIPKASPSGPFFTSLEEVHAFLMSDDTFIASTTIPGASLSSELQACLMSDSTTVEKASTSSSNDSVGCAQTENIDDDDGLLQEIEALMKFDDTPMDSTMIPWLEQ
uniref:NAC domain-containing protein n=1 Tax=Musa acuminata subsp. malaccensis TaxID=214687 RepID=A0A804KSC9_MUSAM|nr:PREDICTED: NAC domain-containing protein 14-like [Musa acuminata subsp. malaccensis]